MKQLVFFALFSFASLTTFAQVEICNNGLDDDFDGFIDCYDGSCANDPSCDGIFLGNDATCETPPPVFPAFTMSLDFSSPNETTNHLARMAVGDLDRDDMPEIITMNRYTKTLYILNGNNGSVKKQASVNWEPYWEIAIANVDNDACGEIFFIGYEDPPGPNNAGIYMYAYDCQLNFLWRTVNRFIGDPVNFGVADFDGDGKAEIYAKDEIFDAKTGVRLVRSTANHYHEINGGPVAVNMLGDEKLELVLGLAIYRVNFGTRTADAGSLTLLQSRPEYFVRDIFNATSVADYNQDGFLDVLASGSTIGHDQNTTVFFWDVQNNTLKTYSDPQPALGSNYANGWMNGTGRLNIADLDGNEKMNASYVSGRFLYALDENFNLLWRVNINEETSGYTGCTLFDFNGDGKSEIVYRDERFLYIIEGTDGSIYSQQACISRTNREYPIVADVDADGSTELCVTCGFNDVTSANNFNDLPFSRYSHVRVFKSAAEPWVPARRVWNQHGYFVVNVNDDLTIPEKIQAHQLVFSTGNCTQGPNRPLNKFLNQSPYLNSEGCPTYASADIAFSVEPTIVPPQCPDLNFKVSFEITNLGDVAVSGNIPVTFYTTNPLLPGATKLNTITIPVNQLAKGTTVSVVDAVVTGIGSDSVYVVLNDAGTTVPTPIIFPNSDFFECDYDNIRSARVIPLPAQLTALQVNANQSCMAMNNGVARAFVPTNGNENMADYNFYWSNGNVAKPIASIDHVGSNYNGLAPGTYTVYARHKTANCNSDTVQVVVGTVNGIQPNITITNEANQTSCAPANGRLKATIAGGGNAGYTFEWFDISLNPLGIVGPVANNLEAGSYLVVVSLGSCTKISQPAVITGPLIPDIQSSVTANVQDCANPNSGAVAAQAFINGVAQDNSNYTFKWYNFNIVSGTSGNIVPGAGPARTGLPVGSYRVEITDNTTGCENTGTPVTIISSTVVPTAQITQLAPQTSCDPASPNGAMEGNVLIGGIVQNPAGFTFEWFRGQNTLPENKVTTVSGVNGKIVNQVAGGGTPYTLRVTTPLNCSATTDLIITEQVVRPVVTLAQLSPNTICDPAKASLLYNGSLQATVTNNGIAVTLPDNNYRFIWRDPSNQVIAVTDDKNPVLTGLLDGNSYSLVVEKTDVKCVSDPDTEPIIKATTLPLLASSSTGSTNCDPALTPDGTATVSVTNATPGDVFQYQWYSGNTVVPANALTATNNGTQTTAIRLGGPTNAPNPYTVLVTNTTSGCENTAIQFVADNSVIPVLSFDTITPNSICAPASSYNGALQAKIDNQVGAITNYEFTWYNGTTNTPANKNTTSSSVLLDKLDAGFYTVEVKNTATGCQSSPITNQVPNAKVLPVISITSNGSNTCDPTITPDGTITATVTNGGTNFSYVWTAVAPSAPITIADNNANQSTAIHVGGPTNAPNSYQVVVTNTDTGCQNTGTGLVADISTKPTFTLTPFANTVCDISIPGGPTTYNGHLDVTAVTHPALGTSTVSYEWFNANSVSGLVTGTIAGATSSILGQLDNGKYGARVKVDALGCVSDIVIEDVLDNLTPVPITTNTDPSTTCAPLAPNGVAEVIAPIGANIRYQWYDGSLVAPAQLKVGETAALLGNDLQGGINSNFTVVVTDLTNGCKNNAVMNVPDGSVVPTISLSVVQHNTICDVPTIDPNGRLLAIVAGVSTNYTITWIGGVSPAIAAGANGEEFTKLSAGNYAANVTDNISGCKSLNDTEIINNNFTFPVITFAVTDQTSCDAASPNGGLVALGDGTTSGRSFNWFSGVGTGASLGISSNTLTNRASGDFTVTVKIDATGCTSTGTQFIPNNKTNPTLNLSAISPVTTCGVSANGSAQATVGGVSALPNFNYTLYYVETFTGQTYPSASADVKNPLNVDGTFTLNNATFSQPPVYGGLEPGYLTAIVVDNNTKCESLVKTVQINDNTDEYAITINANAQAGFCGGTGGGIEVTVDRAGTECSTCSYAWYKATPTNTSPINFFNNPPNMGGAATQTLVSGLYNEDLGAPGAPPGVNAGTYTLVVTDTDPAHLGCGNYFIESIDFLNPPAVSITPVQPTVCEAPFNGQVQVDVTGTSAQGYSVRIFQGNGPTGSLVAGPITSTSPVSLDATLLDAGQYFVQVIDQNPSNVDCPIGNVRTLIRQAYAPLVSVQINPNTSCIPGTSADGQVNLTVVKNTLDTTTPNYFLRDVAPLPQGFTLNAAPGNLIGTGASGQSTGFIGGFGPQAYSFRVLDDVSKCFTDLTVNVPDQQDLPGPVTVTPTPETACAPASNGSALVSLSDPVTEFNFDWFINANGTGSVIAAPTAGNGAGTGGELLNQSKVVTPANWAIGTTGFGSGNRSYFVRGVRNATATSGVGCVTEIKQVTIPDQHIQPSLSLVATSNSFCSAPNPGDVGSGSVLITADANPSVAGTQTPVGGFNYSWTNANAGLVSPQNGQAATFAIPQLGNGVYSVTAQNASNGCIVTTNAEVRAAPFFIAITDTEIQHQLICNPDGQIDVTEITIDRSAAGLSNISQGSALPLSSVYNFDWFAATPGDLTTFVPTPLQDVALTPINQQSLVQGSGAGQYQPLVAGTYYVRATRKAGSGVAEGCQSFPVRIDVNDEHKNPVVTLTPFSNTSCIPGIGEGEIEVQIADATNPSFGPFTFNYDWTAGGITDANGNNGDGDNSEGDNDHISNLLTGVYTVKVLNPASGCFTIATTEVLPNATPVFIQDVDVVDQISCNPAGDGSLNVASIILEDRNGVTQTSGTNFSITDFEFDWTRGGIAFIQTTAGTSLGVGNYNVAGFGTPIGAGTYSVVARRISNSPGAGCVSAPFQIAINDLRMFPVASLTPFANTACDPAFAEGAIEVRVADATSVPGPYTFSYTWNAANPTAIAAATTANGDGSGGDGDHPTELLQGVYRVQVRNNQSFCESNAETTLFKNATPIFIPQATALPQIVCSADGSLEVNLVSVTDRNGVTASAPLADFDFIWSRGTLANTIATTDGALGAVTGGTILDRNSYNAIGIDSYFVVARRIAGNVGRGCESAPFRANIADERRYPELTFTSLVNSSCSPSTPNGLAEVSAREISGVNTGPYAFGWQLNSGAVAPTSVQTDTNNSSELTNALNGAYTITATNTVTGCAETKTFEVILDQTPSTPNLIDVSAVDPLDCNPTGSATVTLITIGSQTNSILFPPNVPPNNSVTGADLLNYNYEWYRESVAAGNQLPAGGPFVTTPAITSLLPGTYYVLVHDPTTDCKSGPKEVIISPDNIVYPDLSIAQLMKQVSCNSTVGSASLAATADGQTDTNTNYQFNWYNNLTQSGPVFATTSTISNLLAGDYSITVLDQTTHCISSAPFSIEDESAEFSPVVSMGSQPRTLCVGTDGALLAQVLNTDPTYPYPYTATTYTADIYFGASPNLAAPADIANMPLLPGFVTSFLETGLNEGAYTVRITDNNTGCTGVGIEQIIDSRVYPVLLIEELAPVTNCDPLRPNGVAQVSADGTLAGYRFDWYEGSSATGSPVYTGEQFDLLKMAPQQYTVRGTNLVSGCTTDKNTTIQDGTVPVAVPSIDVLSHLTSCVISNGALEAYVGSDRNTKDYIFRWYDGAGETATPDFIGEIYSQLSAGVYSVTATSLVTGCKSPPKSEEVLKQQAFPDFDFLVQNTACDKNNGYATLLLTSDVPVERIEWFNAAGSFLVGPNYTDAMAGTYRVVATSFFGCETEKDVVIMADIRPYNGISRNEDGRNDIFKIDCIDQYPGNQVQIFNRAGTLVYEAIGYDNTTILFDGRSNRGISPIGNSLPDGTYFYLIDKRDGSKPLAGYLEIVK